MSALHRAWLADEEFCDKARLEGKVRYAKVLRAAAEALAEDCRERGITGGWGEE